jgi:hypothetical protein
MDDVVYQDPEVEMLVLNKQDGYKYRERRQDDWTENYTLYRDKVTTNRLTQRQSVNLPLMKQHLRVLLNNIDDMPVLYFQNLDNDKQKEVFQNEYWKWTAEQNRMEILDIVDKRQDLFFGRTFDQWQIIDGAIKMSIIDPEDILVSRYVNPTDLHTSRFLIHTHIFVPLSSLKLNKDYDPHEVAELEKWYATDIGLIKAAENVDSLQRKNEKMVALGLVDVNNPVLGETYVELTMHFLWRDGEKDAEKQMMAKQIFLYIEADNHCILLKKPLEDVIGVTKDHFWRTHFPYNSWADDIDMQDFWTDGVADIVRTPNKVLNAWFSQMVENRTLRNLNMQVYDGTKEGFTPSTYNPSAWGWFAVPGKPSEVYQQMEVADLSDSIDEITMVTQMIEKATGATSTLQGAQTENKITLGEVQLALGEAKDRVKGISKFYTQVWKDRGEMFLKLIEAAPEKLDAVKIYKKGKNTDNIYSRQIEPADWMTELGYSTKVWSQDEKDTQDTKQLEKLNAVRSLFPGNMKMDEITKQKALEFAGVQPDDINAIMEEEQRNMAVMRQNSAMAQTMGAGMVPGGNGNVPQGGISAQPMPVAQM